MMHQVAWVRGKIKGLIVPYLLTGVPSLIFVIASVGLIELSHTDEAEFSYLGLNFDSTTAIDFILISIAILGALFCIRKSLPQLRAAWESANEITEDLEKEGSS